MFEALVALRLKEVPSSSAQQMREDAERAIVLIGVASSSLG